MLKLVKTWRDYTKPADEREELEYNRSLKAPFWLLAISSFLVGFYLVNYSQVAYVHHLEGVVASTGTLTTMNVLSVIMFLAIIIACASVAGYQQQKGLFYGSKFGSSIEFPVAFSLGFSAIYGIGSGAISAGLRLLAEVQLVGIGEAYLLADILLGLFFGIFIFGGSIVALYFNWKAAKKHADALAAELED